MSIGNCPDCGIEYRIGQWPFPCHGSGHELGPAWTGDAQIHPSERVVYIRNPQTGEIRIPGRADRPTHPKYLAAGFTERCDAATIPELRRLEKTTGLIHEKSNYDNSGLAERDTSPR